MVAMLLAFGIAASVPAQANDAVGSVVVVGDSLSAGYGIDIADGWVALIDQRLDETGIDVDVINASVSGDTTSDGLARLPGILKRHSPSVVVLELGGNDGLRAQPPTGIEANLEAMIRLSLDADAAVVLVSVRLPPNYGPRYIESFESIFGNLASRLDVQQAHLMLESLVVTPGMMQADGVHPTAKAQPLIADNLLEPIQKALNSRPTN